MATESTRRATSPSLPCQGLSPSHSHSPAQDGRAPPGAVEKAWEALPPKARQGKTAFREQFALAVRDRRADPQGIVQAMAGYYASPVGRGEYFLLPANFVKDGHYDDDPESWKERRDDRSRKIKA